MEKFTVVIPTLNERAAIGKLALELRSLYPNSRIIVSDDGSTDGTREDIKKLSRRDPNILLLDRSKSRVHGLTASVLGALGKVKTDFVVVMDGDLQHPPETVGVLVKALSRGASVAIARRVRIEGGWPIERHILSKGAEILGLAVLIARRSARTRDPLSGFFAVRSKVFRKAVKEHGTRFEPKGYKVLFDLLKILPGGTPVSEIPYVFNKRRMGASKIGARHIVAFARSLVR